MFYDMKQWDDPVTVASKFVMTKYDPGYNKFGFVMDDSDAWYKQFVQSRESK